MAVNQKEQNHLILCHVTLLKSYFYSSQVQRAVTDQRNSLIQFYLGELMSLLELLTAV